jgi:hypothetical protein
MVQIFKGNQQEASYLSFYICMERNIRMYKALGPKGEKGCKSYKLLNQYVILSISKSLPKFTWQILCFANF